MLNSVQLYSAVQRIRGYFIMRCAI